MKKSIIVSFIILILVIGWFVSGQFFGNGNYNYKDSDNKNQKISEKNNSSENLNKIIVQTEISNYETIDQSIFLQGQTKSNRTIDIKSKTTGNIVKKYFKRGDIIKKNDQLIEISIEDRQELLKSLE